MKPNVYIDYDLSYQDLRDRNFNNANLGRANLKGADLSNANLQNAVLSGANLLHAILAGANLQNAILHNAIGNMVEIASMQLETYQITFTKDVLQIGCCQYTHEEWRNFTDEEIDDMDERALNFWKKWKDFIFQAIKLKFG